jgi:hypothetical protein
VSSLRFPTRQIVLPLLMTSTSALLLSGVARADTALPDASGFSVQASADAMKMDVQTGLFGGAFPGLPPDEPPFEGSAAYTEAVYDDLGNNSGVASTPYPGSFAVGFPGLLRGVSRPGGQPGIGQAPPLPNWPFIVSSTYPGREKSSQVNGPYGITATSGPNGSEAAAKAGTMSSASLLSPTSHSSALWDPSSGTFVAKADSSFVAFALDPVLELADVESHASVTSAPGADKPTTSASFEVGTFTVAGMKVGVTDKGFIVGPSSNPRPDLGSLKPVLSAAGIEIQFLPTETTPTGIVSAGLRISAKQTFPVQGPVQETWTVGRVRASLNPGTAYSSTDFSAYGSPEPNGGSVAPRSGGSDCPSGSQRFGTECYPNVAVVTPTLGFISFGATFGGPIMCFMGTGALQSIGRGLGATAVANQLGKEATPYCTSGPNQFGDGIAQLAKALGPLTVINPVVNPVLDNMANGFRSFATSNGSAIAPFGPAAYEMGAFVEFFKGS